MCTLESYKPQQYFVIGDLCLLLYIIIIIVYNFIPSVLRCVDQPCVHGLGFYTGTSLLLCSRSCTHVSIVAHGSYNFTVCRLPYAMQ